MLTPRIVVLFVSLCFLSGCKASEDEKVYYELDYGLWRIAYNCEKRGYEYYEYTTVPDQGSFERYESFHQEKSLPKRCRQRTTKAYPGRYNHPELGEMKYDRGHGVHQNILDHDKNLMRLSNMFSNIVPQESTLNRRGLWRYTEKLTECARDQETITVYGGVIWGDNLDNDVNLVSHGVPTPDYLWKVIVYSDGEANAWIMPNNKLPADSDADKYLVRPIDIETRAGWTISVSDSEKNELDSKHRPLVKCSLK